MPFQPPVSRKQAAVINDPKKFILVSGPRFSSKSFGVMHRLAWRMWKIPNYVGCIIGKTTSASSDSGIWTLLTEKIMPIWLNAEFGMEWVTQPRQTGVTHKLYFDVTNEAGGKSRMYLDSLDIEDAVEDKYKNRVFCDIVLSEASNFKNKATMDCLSECLRLPDVPQDKHSLILDTNPAEEGQDHFIWKEFFEFPSVDFDNVTDDIKQDYSLADMDEATAASMIKGLRERQAQMSVHLFQVSDNEFISEEQKRAQFAKYCTNASMLARYFYGEWIGSSGEGIFGEVWRPEIHLVGDRPTPASPAPEEMLPEDECIELGGGWDIGNRRNTAVAIIEPIMVEIEEYGQHVMRTGFKVLDEYVSVGVQQKIWKTAEIMQEKQEFWNSQCKRAPIWHNYSDSSSFDVSGQTETSEAQDIFRLTDGLIELKSIIMPGLAAKGNSIKGHGGIERGIDIIQRLLFEQRLWVNAARCPHTAEMFANIRRAKSGRLSGTNPLKHILDAIRYYCQLKCFLEMRQTPRLTGPAKAARILVTGL